MIGRVRTLLGLKRSAVSEPEDPRLELELAAAAILVEASLTDGHVDDRELAAVRAALAAHFGLGEKETAELVERAEEIARNSVDWNRFTRVLKRGFDAGERLQMMEMLWRVVLADGVLHAWEDTLVRQIAALLHVSDHDRALTRRRARETIAAGDA